MMLRYILVLSALLLLLAACGPANVPEGEGTATASVAENDGTADNAPTEEEPGEVAEESPPPEFADADYETTESGLQIAIIEAGAGEPAEGGKIVLGQDTGERGEGSTVGSSGGGRPSALYRRRGGGGDGGG